MAKAVAKIDADPKYDVAISFLVKNETIARELNARLEGALKVFFFPRKQEELAGTDGLESMREPFIEARVAVVIFDEPWGATNWTRVEEMAIKDRCLEQGWDGLMFVQASKTATLPKWLPKTHVRFSLDDYGLDELAGAIKAQVQRLGGKIHKLDALSRAKQVKSEQDYLQAREAMMRDSAWISGTVHASIRRTMLEVVRLIDKVNISNNLSIEANAQDRRCILRANGISLGTGWKQPIANLVTDYQSDECYLRVTEFSGNLTWPGDNKWFIEQPKVLKEHKFKVEVSHARELVWKESGKKELIAAEKLADRIAQIFLDLMSRSNNGKV